MKKRAANRNESVTFTPNQVRTKFKKAIQLCKKAALTIKTASGIKRFQDDKNYGQWFEVLYSVVKSRESCQPELAVEPSACTSCVSESVVDLDESSGTPQPKLFIPVKTSKRKGKKKDSELLDVLECVKNALENDPMKDFVAYLKEEAEKSRQHELRLFELMMHRPFSQPVFMPEASENPQQRTMSQPSYLGSTFQRTQSQSPFCNGYPLDPSSSGWLNLPSTPERGIYVYQSL